MFVYLLTAQKREILRKIILVLNPAKEDYSIELIQVNSAFIFIILYFLLNSQNGINLCFVFQLKYLQKCFHTLDFERDLFSELI